MPACANPECDRVFPPSEGGKCAKRYCSARCTQTVYRRQTGHKPSRYGRRPAGSTAERFYTDEELDWLKAVDRYCKEQGRVMPDARGILQIARDLGYTKETTDAT